MNAFSVLLVAFCALTAHAQEGRDREDCNDEQRQRQCGAMTQDAAKCLTPCFREAQHCFQQVGTNIARIQQCMLDKSDDERGDNCNTCIAGQLAARCDEYFEDCGQLDTCITRWSENPGNSPEARCKASNDDEQSIKCCYDEDSESCEQCQKEKFYFKTFLAYKKFCGRMSTKGECKDMGCNWTENGGCTAKLKKNTDVPKLKCKRVRNRSMCNSLKGCTLRKKGVVKDNGKTKVCKGDVRFPFDE